jgi:hypothetical protein
MMDINFKWTRSYAYEFATQGQPGKSIVPVGKKRDTFEPLKLENEKPLFLQFAELDGSEAACLRFAHHWGLLTTEAVSASETLETWRQQIKDMRARVAFFGTDTTPAKAPKLAAGAGWKITDIEALLVPTRSDTKPFALALQPRNLMHAMYLQHAVTLAGGASIRTCKQCGLWFESGASNSRRRSVAIFCSESCKNRFHYLERARLCMGISN